jgi:predicted membrane-bound spermidine synthase/Flp pilus assembly protein TadD
MSKTQRTFWLNATVFLTGAGIMTVELVASRLIARYLGSSLYTWTGVLSVILAGMSIGNYIGGRMADSAKSLPKRISAMCFAGAGACIAILWLNAWAGASTWLMGLSWPLRILLHMAWAFLMPAVVLGTISPMVAKLAIERAAHTGRAIGTLYAWNAVGSIVGTLMTGFYLTAWMGSVRIVVGMALLLASLGACYAISAWRRGEAGRVARAGVAAGWALFFGLFLLATLPGEGIAGVAGALKLLNVPAEEDAVYFEETQYQILTVTGEPGNPYHRAFYQDKLRHSEADLRDWGDLKYPYMRIYEALVNMKAGKNDKPVRLLLLGGGGYVFPNYLFRARPGSEIVVVEIDPGVTLAAQLAFGFPTNAPVDIHHMDARNYVAEALRRNREEPGSVEPFDFIVCDSVSDYSVPYQLTTKEFMAMVRDLLKPEGVYVMNLIDAYDVGEFMNAIAQTFEEAFPFRGAISAVPELGPRNTTVFVGANEPLALDQLPEWTTRPGVLEGKVFEEEHFDDLRARNGIAVLTDDWAPVENMLAKVVKTDMMGLLAAAQRAGVVAAEKSDYPRAVIHFRRALEIAPGDEGTLVNLAHAQELMEDESGALDSYAALIQLHPSNVGARNRAAMILAKRGHVGPALEQWGESLKINPMQPDVLNNLGALAMQEGNREAAVRYWRQGLEYAPDSSILLRNLAAVESSSDSIPSGERQAKD